MEKFTELKSKLDALFRKPLLDMEAKFQNDLNRIEDLKYTFYDLDKIINLISPTNQEHPDKDKPQTEKKFRKFNSTLNMESAKKRENNLNKSADLKEEVVKNNKKIEITPVKRREKPNVTTSVDDKINKTLKKEKGLFDSKREFTRNANYNKNNSTIDAINIREKNPAFNNTFNNNGINNEDKEFMEKVKNTQRNNDYKGIIKKEGIEKLKKDLEKKTSKVNINERSKKNLNLSADNFNPDLAKKKEKKEKDKLPPLVKKQLSNEKVVIKPNNQSNKNKANLNRTSDNINTNNASNATSPKIRKIIIPKSNGIFSGVKFDNNMIKCLAIFSCSNFMSLKEKINFILFNKTLSSLKMKSILFKEIIRQIEQIQNKVNEKLYPYLENESLKELINRTFIPSKTAQNGMNFVKTLDENDMAKKEQPEEIIILFKLIYLLIGEDYESISPSNGLLQNLIDNIYPKLNVENIKSLFLNYIVKNTNNLTSKHVEKIVELCENNPKVFNSSEIMKYNKAMSFMCFIIKEIYDFIKQKAEDGTYLISLRKLNSLSVSYQEKINILKQQI